MKRFIPVLLIWQNLVLLPVVLWSQNTEYYVSPKGRDENPGTRNLPFRTIEKAKDAVRRINRKMTSDIVVYLEGGTYVLKQTLTFDSNDSGFNGHSVVYRNVRTANPVISGGDRVTGWTRHAGKIWKTRTDIPSFRQIFVNGHLATRAKGQALPGARLVNLPAKNSVEAMARREGYFTSHASLAHWRNPSDIELVFDLQWTRSICKVADIEESAGGAVLTMLEPYFTLARMKDGRTVELPTFIQNAFELLDDAGEWYFDRPSSTIFYIPREGEDIGRSEIIVPRLEKLIELQGTLDRPVHNLRFEGLSFSHTTWNQPSEIGHIELQANFTLSQVNLMLRSSRYPTKSGTDPAYLGHPFGEGKKSPANIVLRAAKSVQFERCKFVNLGGAGIDLEYGSQDNLISGCEFSDISGTAVQVGDVVDHHPKDRREVVKGNRIVNNYIHHVATEYIGGVGVFAGYTDGTLIAHNEISFLPYSGVSIGWGWGEADAAGDGYWQPIYNETPTTARNNVCEYNHIHNVLQKLWDGGSIYTLGSMPGSVIRGNHVHDNEGWPGGIYLDEGSAYIEVTQNVVYSLGGKAERDRSASPINYNNRRRNKIETCLEHNNHLSIRPGEPGFPQELADKAGLEPAYRDLLKQSQSSSK